VRINKAKGMRLSLRSCLSQSPQVLILLPLDGLCLLEWMQQVQGLLRLRLRLRHDGRRRRWEVPVDRSASRHVRRQLEQSKPRQRL